MTDPGCKRGRDTSVENQSVRGGGDPRPSRATLHGTGSGGMYILDRLCLGEDGAPAPRCSTRSLCERFSASGRVVEPQDRLTWWDAGRVKRKLVYSLFREMSEFMLTDSKTQQCARVMEGLA